MKRILTIFVVALLIFAGSFVGGQTVRFALPQVAGDPGTVANGDLWYNTSSGAIRGRANGTTISLVGGGSSGSITGGSCSAGLVVTAIDSSGTPTCGAEFWTTVRKTTVESVASNTTPQADDELFFTMAASGWYKWEAYIAYDSPAGAGTPDLKYNFACPATCDMAYIVENFVTTAETQTATSGVTNSGTNATAGTNTTSRVLTARGWVTSSAGGTGASGFLFSWSQNTSGLNATRVREGSVIRYRQMF